MDSSNYTYFERSKSKDPNAPTVIVLDDFRSEIVPIVPGQFAIHGMLSLAGAQNSGYSTIGIDFNDPGYPYRDYTDYSQPLNRIDADIHSGKLKGIGKGDVLNISLVNPPLTFADASQALGFTITAQNLASEKNHILSRMDEILKDRHLPKVLHDRAQAIVDTNRAIERLQADGLTVIHSAGNKGADTFAIDFMTADVQLSSNKPSGKPDTFSSSNSLTTEADGILPIVFHPEMDLLDPTPIEQQKGSFEIVGSGIFLRNKSVASFVGNTLVFDREKVDIRMPLPIAKPTAPVIAENMYLPQMTVNEPPPLSSWNVVASRATSSVFGDLDTGMTYKTHPTTFAHKASLSPGQMLVAGMISGTSFSNIKYLHTHFAEFRQEKADATYLKIWNPNETFPLLNKSVKQ